MLLKLVYTGPYEDLLTSVKRCSRRGTSHDHLDWPRLSYREQFKEGDEEADSGNDEKTTSKSGLALNGILLLRKAENLEEWRKLVVKSTVVLQRSARLRDR